MLALRNNPTFYRLLRKCCTASVDTIFENALPRYGFQLRGDAKTETRYAYRPGLGAGAPLIVCHADTVMRGGRGPHKYRQSMKNGLVNSIALDDRLGLALMLHGIKTGALADCAFLVCDNEEIGNSTAQVFNEFDCAPVWMTEFDRRGDDVVCYEYDTPMLRSILESLGFRIGRGTFSDICYLSRLGVAGFNMGIGYHNEHSEACYADIETTEAQWLRFLAFYAAMRDIRLAYDSAYADVMRYSF